MSSRGLLCGCHEALPTTWTVDTSPLEGALQHAHGRDGCRFVVFEQFDANPTGTPLGVGTSEPAGASDHGLRIGRG
jgi:hypothetical protein